MVFRPVTVALFLFCFLFNNNIWITAALSLRGQHHDEQGQQFPLVMGSDDTHHHHQLALNPSDRIREALKKAQIIPDVLDDFQPTLHIHLTYHHHRNTNKKPKTINFGTLFPSPHILSSPPHFSLRAIPTTTTSSSSSSSSSTSASNLNDSNKNITYTLLLTDPDAPSRKHPTIGQMCHWIITNLPHPSSSNSEMEEWQKGKEEEEEEEEGLTVVIPYLAPAPPKGTGWHRYVFVLLSKEEGEGVIIKKPERREHWGYGKEGKGVREWVADNEMNVIGANFFYARNKKQ